MLTNYKIRLTRRKKDTLLDYLLIYAMLLCTSGFYFHSKSLAYTVPAIVAVIAVLFHNIEVKKRIFIITGILLLNAFFSSVIGGDELRTILFLVIAISSAFIISSVYSKQEYIDIFVNLIFVLCICSIIIFTITFISTSFVSRFPRLYDGNSSAYFLGITFIRPATRWVAMRNQSIFWEPGVFQTYIVLAFMFEISVYGKRRTSRIVTFVIALVTTMSTTGYIALFISIVIWLLEVNHKKRTKILRFLISFFAILGLAFIVYDLLPHGINNKTFDKLYDIINGVSTNISVSTRRNSVIYSLRTFAQSPLWGQGSKGLSLWHNVNEDGLNLMVFTPGNWLARFGIVFGGIAIIGFTQIRDYLFEVGVNRFLVALLFIIIIATEAYTTNASILTWVMYGWKCVNTLKRKSITETGGIINENC